MWICGWWIGEVIGELKVCIHTLKEGECEWYMCACVLYSFIERRRVRIRYVCLYLLPIHRRKGSTNGVHVWYTCKCMVSYSCIGYFTCVRCCGHRKSWLLCDKYIKNNIDNHWHNIRVLIHQINKENSDIHCTSTYTDNIE